MSATLLLEHDEASIIDLMLDPTRRLEVLGGQGGSELVDVDSMRLDVAPMAGTESPSQGCSWPPTYQCPYTSTNCSKIKLAGRCVC